MSGFLSSRLMSKPRSMEMHCRSFGFYGISSDNSVGPACVSLDRRLRAAKVSIEDRQDLLGHEARRITTHYSAPEIENLVEAANQITKSRESPTRTVLRVISAEG